MKITKRHVGKIVKLEFLDHCMGNPDPVKCVVVGQVVKLTKTAVTLRFWEVEEGFGEHNNEVMSIITSTIIGAKVLS